MKKGGLTWEARENKTEQFCLFAWRWMDGAEGGMLSNLSERYGISSWVGFCCEKRKRRLNISTFTLFWCSNRLDIRGTVFLAVYLSVSAACIKGVGRLNV